MIGPDHPLVVVHTPKCGGTSLFASLRNAFGAGAMFIDYVKTNPGRLKTPDGHSVIYGHFAAEKYAHIDNATWVTMLREPVDRLLSIYFVWRFYPLDRLRNEPEPLRRAVNKNEIGLLDFARNPRFSEAFHRKYFGNFDMTRFDLIILNDHYAEGIEKLSGLIGKPLGVEHRNVSATRSDVYAAARQEVLNDPAMLNALKDILRKETEFYQMCTNLPAARRSVR